MQCSENVWLNLLVLLRAFGINISNCFHKVHKFLSYYFVLLTANKYVKYLLSLLQYAVLRKCMAESSCFTKGLCHKF